MSNSASDSRQIARRYAEALFDIASSKKGGDKKAGAELADIAALAQSHDGLKETINNPTISRAKKTAVLTAIAKKTKLSDAVAGTLNQMAENNRLEVLADTAEAYEAILAEANGEVKAEIITAGGMAKKNIDALTKAVEKALGKKVSAEITENPDLLGGAMIKIGSRLLDCSVRGRLQRLEDSLNNTISNG